MDLKSCQSDSHAEVDHSDDRDKPIDPLIRDAEGADMLGCSKATWWRRVADGTLPRPLKIGGMSRWERSDVFKLIEDAALNRFKS